MTHSSAWVATALAVAGLGGVAALSSKATSSHRSAGGIESADSRPGTRPGFAGSKPAAAADFAENPRAMGLRQAAPQEPGATGPTGGTAKLRGLSIRPNGRAGMANRDASQSPGSPIGSRTTDGSALAGADAKVPIKAEPHISAISRGDESYRSRYGYAAYSQLLLERHRSALAGSAAPPAPPSATGVEPQFASSAPGPLSPADSHITGVISPSAGRADWETVPDARPAAQHRFGGIAPHGSDTPSLSAIPREPIRSPVLVLRKSGGAYVLDAGKLPGNPWRVEHADSLSSGGWKDVGPLDGTNPIVVFRDALGPSGFWRVRSGGR